MHRHAIETADPRVFAPATLDTAISTDGKQPVPAGEIRSPDGKPLTHVEFLSLGPIPHRMAIYAIRAVPEDICRRIRHARPHFARHFVQIEVDTFGDRAWLNVRRAHVVPRRDRPAGQA